MNTHERPWFISISDSRDLAGLRDRLEQRDSSNGERRIERIAFAAMIVWCAALGCLVTVAAAWLLSLE
jgi:hypothetical protein